MTYCRLPEIKRFFMYLYFLLLLIIPPMKMKFPSFKKGKNDFIAVLSMDVARIVLFGFKYCSARQCLNLLRINNMRWNDVLLCIKKIIIIYSNHLENGYCICYRTNMLATPHSVQQKTAIVYLLFFCYNFTLPCRFIPL